MRKLFALLSASVLFVLAAVPASASESEQSGHNDVRGGYLALGDSVPFGFDPLADASDADNFIGYPEIVAKRLVEHLERSGLVVMKKPPIVRRSTRTKLPEAARITISIAAATAMRMKVSVNGGISITATPAKKKDAPHMSDRSTRAAQSRALMGWMRGMVLYASGRPPARPVFAAHPPTAARTSLSASADAHSAGPAR